MGVVRKKTQYGHGSNGQPPATGSEVLRETALREMVKFCELHGFSGWLGGNKQRSGGSAGANQKYENVGEETGNRIQKKFRLAQVVGDQEGLGLGPTIGSRL